MFTHLVKVYITLEVFTGIILSVIEVKYLLLCRVFRIYKSHISVYRENTVLTPQFSGDRGTTKKRCAVVEMFEPINQIELI